MKSIKPGRGPSGLAFIGSLGAAVFGVFWTVMALSMTDGAPGIIGIIFPMFGIVFVAMAVIQGVYHYRNASGRNRYSMMDITDGTEEGDPSQDWVRETGESGPNIQGGASASGSYCPYCGTPTETDHRFCKRCGKGLR